MRDDDPVREQEDDGVVREQEDAAADEAAKIGGLSGMEGMDEARRAAAEHGGGEAEGFEEAEKLLEEQSTHGESHGNPFADAPRIEAEEDPSVHGEADEETPPDL